MTRHVIRSLDSLDLAKYSVQVRCIVCSGENAFDAERCRHCYAPMAMSHQAAAQKTKPHFIALLGGPSAGKTVFLAMMIDMLSRQAGDMQVFARGAFSVSLQQGVIDHLSRCQFPDPTPQSPDQWAWIHCQASSRARRRPQDLVLADVAGAAIAEEMDRPYSQPVVRTYLSKCAAALVILDAEKLEQGDETPDFLAMKSISYLWELDEHRRRGWPQRPVAVVFAKGDRSEDCRRDPMAYAAKRTPGFFKQSSARLRNVGYFACGAVGATAHQRGLGGLLPVPLRIEPFGFTQPFAWLTRHLK